MEESYIIGIKFPYHAKLAYSPIFTLISVIQTILFGYLQTPTWTMYGKIHSMSEEELRKNISEVLAILQVENCKL